MSEAGATGSLDFEALRSGVESRDAKQLKDLYADDAEIRIVNRLATPSSPMVFSGKEQIAKYIDDVSGREMTHHVQDEVIGENRVAYREECDYPDGTRVLSSTTLELKDGKILRQEIIELWDK